MIIVDLPSLEDIRFTDRGFGDNQGSFASANSLILKGIIDYN